MKRVLLASNYAHNDVSSLLRSHGPFSLMRDEVEVVVPFKEDGKDYLESRWWTNFRNWLHVDCCFLHRPFGFYGQQIIESAKTHGVPLWVDHDDDLLSIPETNPCYGIVKLDKENPSIEMSYVEADIITCQSTLMHTELRMKYDRGDAIHIPITLDDRLVRFKRIFNVNKKVMWRGSPTHANDLLHYRVELQKLFDKHQDIDFCFFGMDPRELGFVGNFIVYKEFPMFRYYDLITCLNSMIHIVPLEPSKFNRVKSHLSWLDGTLSGSITVAPDFPEFKRPGIFPGVDQTFFCNKVSGLLEATHDLSGYNKLSWECILDNYLTSKWNKVRSEIVRNL